MNYWCFIFPEGTIWKVRLYGYCQTLRNFTQPLLSTNIMRVCTNISICCLCVMDKNVEEILQSIQSLFKHSTFIQFLSFPLVSPAGFTTADWPLLTPWLCISTLHHHISQNGHWTSQAHLQNQPFNPIRASQLYSLKWGSDQSHRSHQHKAINAFHIAQNIWPVMGGEGLNEWILKMFCVLCMYSLCTDHTQH